MNATKYFFQEDHSRSANLFLHRRLKDVSRPKLHYLPVRLKRCVLILRLCSAQPAVKWFLFHIRELNHRGELFLSYLFLPTNNVGLIFRDKDNLLNYTKWIEDLILAQRLWKNIVLQFDNSPCCNATCSVRHAVEPSNQGLERLTYINNGLKIWW